MSTALSPSLMNLNESFPVKYSIEFYCSESNLEEMIEKVASFTSKVYATFPALGKERREQLKKAGVWFGELDKGPSSAECEQFEESLKKEIIAVLNQDENSLIQLSTDYYPEKILRKVSESVFDKKYQLGFLFPYKTYTRIYLNEKGKKLCLDMNFKSLAALQSTV
jgi:hypothetical protein